MKTLCLLLAFLGPLQDATLATSPKTQSEKLQRGRSLVADPGVFAMPLPAVQIASGMGLAEAEQHIPAWGAAPRLAEIVAKYGAPDRREERSAVGPDSLDLVVHWYGEYGLGSPNPARYPANHSAMGRVVFVEWKKAAEAK